MLKKTDEEQLYGYEKELGIEIKRFLQPYLSAVYGNEKEIDRLLSFKVGIECKNIIMDLIESIIINAVMLGIKKQEDEGYEKMSKMQSQLDYYIKRDGNATKERKARTNV